MKKISMSFFLIVMFTVILLSFPIQAQSPQTFTNASVHDPSVIEVDGEYYVFGSHLALAKSSDLKNWTQLEDRVHPNNSLFEDVTEDLSEALEWAQTDTLWAPDVIQLEDGRYYMYYNACEGSSPRSALGIAVSDDVEGPYKDLGIILRSGMTEEESSSVDGTPYDDIHYPKIYDATVHPNVVDPHVFFDKEDKLWMVYGSYSGGIFILELDPNTGKPFANQGYGTKLLGGNHSRIEAPYIVYNKDADAYYLYLSYGGLDADGGYNVRVAKSDNPDGPYYDIQGNDMRTVKGEDGSFFQDEAIAPTGSKIIGNHLLKSSFGEPGPSHGYVSPGHNSVYVNEVTGEQFLIFHTRFPSQGETHQVRVHSLYINEEGWPVAAPFRYHEDRVIEVGEEQLLGTYKMVLFSSDISEEIDESVTVQLAADGTIEGDVTGNWTVDGKYIEITIEEEVYKGVVLNQWNPIAEKNSITFSSIATNGQSLWGVQSDENSFTDEEIVERVIEKLNIGNTNEVLQDLNLPTEGEEGSTISWFSSNEEVITNAGKINRPPYGFDASHATLTARVSKGDAVAERIFEVSILPETLKGLVARYSFENNLIDQVSGDEASITGNLITNNGGTISFVEGRDGKAAKFDGSSGIRLQDGLINSNIYSVSLWLKPEELHSFTTSFFGSESENSWISLVPGGIMDRKDWTLWTGEDWFDGYSNLSLSLNEWNHLTIVVENGHLSLYMNGEMIEQYDGFPNVFTSTKSAFSLGVNYWDIPYRGLMDEVMIFNNYALSALEVEEVFQSGSFEFDKTALEKLIREATQYLQDNQFTEGSRESLQNALNDVLKNDIYYNNEKLEEDISIIKEAIDSLEKIQDETEDKNAIILKDISQFKKLDNGDLKVKEEADRFILQKELFAALQDADYVILTNGNVEAIIPVSNLMGDQDIEVVFGKVSESIIKKNVNAVSDLIDFRWEINGENQSFEHPIKIRFNVNADKIDNWDALEVLYLNEKGDKLESYVPTETDKKAKTVSFTVDHFSIYGVFELQNDVDDDSSGDDVNEKSIDSTNDNLNADNDSDIEVQKAEKTAEEKEEQTLPNTSTSIFTFLLLGFFLIFTGFLIFKLTSRKGYINHNK